MYCKCGNQIEGTHKYAEYCRECNVAILDCLSEFQQHSLTDHDTNSSKDIRGFKNEL